MRPANKRTVWLCAVVAIAVIGGMGAERAWAHEWYVTSNGRPQNSGTRESPWDLESALGGRQKIDPGDTIWISGGSYRFPDRSLNSPGFTVRLVGERDKPIHVRAIPGERVTIDGGLSVVSPSDYVWIWDLEILVSENFTMSRELSEPGSHPQSYGRPWGGLNIHAGKGCKYINLVIHDNAQGVSFWRGATDSELHGCIIFDNGWKAPDRGHGHAIYTQNENGIKIISDCIMTGGFGYTMHAYGSERAFVDHYLVQGNVAYNGGTFLIGGGRPSRDIRVLDNVFYNVNLQLGYSAPFNEDCEVRNNILVNGNLAINRFRQVVQEGNLIIPVGAPRPDEAARVILRRNRYDPMRAHVIVFNWKKSATVDVPLDSFATPGMIYRFMDPRDVYGRPVLQGQYTGQPVRLPMQGEFGVWVVLLRQP
ncbi:right-handed parallel beta-helix repeat-containing protein [Thermogutta sp.]|uniref:right-handed parallel beta-helix repeat-containing protein n=1 Tax=Thermogutta sp. TaxID=1962930 RepID=UPI0032200829